MGSALVVSAAVGLITGYYPSFTFVTLALATFRLVEIHLAFLLAPPLVTTLALVLLSKTPIDRRITGGAGLCSYYALVALLFVMADAGEFPMSIVIPWVAWAFIVGLGSSIIVDRVLARLRTPSRRTE